MRVFSEREAEAYLNEELGVKVSVHMLRRYRNSGIGGPAFARPFAAIEYRQDDLDAWVASRRANRVISSVAAKQGLKKAMTTKAAL